MFPCPHYTKPSASPQALDRSEVDRGEAHVAWSAGESEAHHAALLLLVALHDGHEGLERAALGQGGGQAHARERRGDLVRPVRRREAEAHREARLLHRADGDGLAVLDLEIGNDLDGVPDDMDKCPNTQAKAPVDTTGCPADNAGDGVADYLDKCPDTFPDVLVNASGCPYNSKKNLNSIAKQVKFRDSNEEPLNSAYTAVNDVIELMRRYGFALEVKVSASGPRAKAVSEARAEHLREIFKIKGFDEKRVQIEAVGAAFPPGVKFTAKNIKR